MGGFQLRELKVSVVTPLLQAFLSGVFLSVGGLAVLRLAGVKAGFTHWVAVFGFGSGVVWFYLLRAWLLAVRLAETPVTLERNTRTLDVQPSRVRVELIQERGNVVQFLDLPAEPAQLRQLAGGVLRGEPFAETAWCGRGKPFSRSQFSELRNELVKRGLLRWRNPSAPAQGVEVTPALRAVFRHLAAGQGNHYLPTGTGDIWET